ncbi:ribose abc transport system, atp-binding protein rbsa [hydrocarbon metagenome]|uniref:Ribose abc transport system, atp-binding protein rbsa n=1 Tax=hydrocarbon metagenome TaxID=938273 RepID=A0A0W8E9L4_9ZZZZ
MLKISGISKSFGQQEVLKSVDLDIMPGEIHGLVGENGAGKSTLLNILFGRDIIRNTGGYSGEIYVDEKKVNIYTPRDALELGIGMVHQEFALIPHMSISENIRIGREYTNQLSEKILGSELALIDKKRNQAEAGKVLQNLGVDPDVNLKIIDLSISLKQFVELAREISRDNLKLLVLDEPTAVLGREDSAAFLKIITDIAHKGTAIIFISHRLEEVVAVCQRITVLRDGKIVDVYQEEQFDINRIAESMIGHSLTKTSRTRGILKEKPIMRFHNFAVAMPGEQIEEFNVNLYQGEILGVAGLSGHGKLALGKGIMGIYPTAGQVTVDERILDTSNPADALTQGIYYVPDDRRETGLLMDHSIMENIIFTAVQQKASFLKYPCFGLMSTIDYPSSTTYTKDCIKTLDIRCQNIHQKVGTLSGGNQQKVCLARAMAMEARILIVSEPSRGIDIGAKARILESLLQINRELGTAIIISSSELDELKYLCDRIVVMYEGKNFGIFSPNDDDLTFAMAFSGKRKEALCAI